MWLSDIFERWLGSKEERVQVVCLANSRKMRNRCIAGIDVRTGEWLRPCFGSGDEGIPWHVRQIGGNEPALLDILEIPLRASGPSQDIQPENRWLGKGPWRKVGEVRVEDILDYCEESKFLLHNEADRVPVNKLKRLEPGQKKSLCLIRSRATFSTSPSYSGKKQVRASFNYGSHYYSLVVTDWEYERRFESYSTVSADCLMTISLGVPYERDNCCYKLVAGVIRL